MTIDRDRGLAGQSKTDATLIEQSLAEPEQFGVIFERYFGQIHQYLARRVGPKIADDLAAEVFVAAFAQRQRYDLARTAPGRGCTGSPPTWPARMSARSSAATVPSPGRTRAWSHPATRTRSPTGSALQPPAALAGALAALDRGDRDVLLLVALADLSYPEVADSLGIPYGTVCSRLSRARRRLRQSLGGSSPASDRPERPSEPAG